MLVVTLVPRGPIFNLAPLGPIDTLAPPVLKLSFIPGRIFIDFRHLNPIIYPPLVCKRSLLSNMAISGKIIDFNTWLDIVAEDIKTYASTIVFDRLCLH